MRARHYLPMFDSLDGRLLLSDISVVSGGMAASGSFTNSAPNIQSNLAMDDSSVVSNVGWYLPGTPPSTPYDPSTPTQGGVD